MMITSVLYIYSRPIVLVNCWVYGGRGCDLSATQQYWVCILSNVKRIL